MYEHTSTLRAPGDRMLYVWFEPWAEGLGFPPGSVIEFRAISSVAGQLELEVSDERTVVYGWAGSTLQVLIGGEVVHAFDWAVPIADSTHSTKESVNMLFGPPPIPEIAGMTAQDPLIRQLQALIETDVVAEALRDTATRVRRQLAASEAPMAWEVVPLTIFSGDLPDSIRSCWIFVIRAGASTGAERHPNSHQRSCSLFGSGTFEVHDGAAWQPHPLTSGGRDEARRRWVTIPPSTWHRLRVGSAEWGMVSFHTVDAGDLIEENPRDPDRLDGPTRQERYAGRQ